MNKSRRDRLTEIQERIADIAADLNILRDEENDAMNNLPESIQYSSVGDTMTEAIDNLDEAVRALEDADSYINDAKGE